MFLKVLTLLAVAAALVWMLMPRVPQAHDLEKCPRCGIWLPTGQRCDCDAPG